MRQTFGPGPDFLCSPLANQGSCCPGLPGPPFETIRPSGGSGQLGNCTNSFTTIVAAGGGGGAGTLIWLNVTDPNVLSAAGGGSGSSGASGAGGGSGGVGTGCFGGSPHCDPTGGTITTSGGGIGGGGGGWRGGCAGLGGKGGFSSVLSNGFIQTLSTCSSGVPSGITSGIGRIRLLFV